MVAARLISGQARDLLCGGVIFAITIMITDQDDQIQAGKEGGWLGKSFLHIAWGQTGAPQWPGVIIITKIINIIINNIINIITKIIIIIIIITTLKVRAANNADYYVSRIGKKESPVRPKQF